MSHPRVCVALVSCLFILFLAQCLLPQDLPAAEVTLQWDANSEPQVTGYKIHYGLASRQYSTVIDVGNATRRTVGDLQEGKVYYFAATAYDGRGNESGYSRELLVDLGQGGSTPTGGDGSGGEALPNRVPAAMTASFTTQEDTSFSGRVQGRDDDGDVLKYLVTEQPSLGTLTSWNASTGDFTYTPLADRFGEDRFTFRVNDGLSVSASAAVTITVQPANDAPWARDLDVEVIRESELRSSVEAGDVDRDPLRFAVTQQPVRGTAAFPDPGRGEFVYKPVDGFLGTDSFRYSVSDGKGGTAAAGVRVRVHPHVEVALEGEHGDLSGSVDVRRSWEASAGEFLYVFGGGGQDAEASAHEGLGRYLVEIPVAGEYQLWMRVRTPGKQARRFQVAWNDAPAMRWESALSGDGRWIWDGVSLQTGGTPRTFKLEKGVHTLTIGFEQAGLALDRVLVTSRPRPFRQFILENGEGDVGSRWQARHDVFYFGRPLAVFDETRRSECLYFSPAPWHQRWALKVPYALFSPEAIPRELQWSVKTGEDFGIWLEVQTQFGARSLIYSPDDSRPATRDDRFFRGLGADLKDGQWHSFVRDLQQDLQEFEPGNTLLQIQALRVYGSGTGHLDDVVLRR